jgi:hypothetical protein
MSMDQWNNELNDLFAGYKATMPDLDPSPDFMPELWKKIEARQTLVVRIKKLTQVFVAAAAAICVILALLLTVPSTNKTIISGNYVDALAEIHPAESLAPLGLLADSQ